MPRSKTRLWKNPHKHCHFGMESLILFFIFIQIFLYSLLSQLYFIWPILQSILCDPFLLLLIFMICQFFKKGLKGKGKRRITNNHQITEM